jgi:hypothetical protein
MRQDITLKEYLYAKMCLVERLCLCFRQRLCLCCRRRLCLCLRPVHWQQCGLCDLHINNKPQDIHVVSFIKSFNPSNMMSTNETIYDLKSRHLFCGLCQLSVALVNKYSFSTQLSVRWNYLSPSIITFLMPSSKSV